MRRAFRGILLLFLIPEIFSIIPQEVEARPCRLRPFNQVSPKNFQSLINNINNVIFPESKYYGSRLISIDCATINSNVYRVQGEFVTPELVVQSEGLLEYDDRSDVVFSFLVDPRQSDNKWQINTTDVEVTVEPSCVLFHGNDIYEPNLAPKKDLPDLQKEADIALNYCQPREQPRLNSIICATTKVTGPGNPFVKIAVQGMLSTNGGMPVECSVVFLRKIIICPLQIDCPPPMIFGSS